MPKDNDYVLPGNSINHPAEGMIHGPTTNKPDYRNSHA